MATIMQKTTQIPTRLELLAALKRGAKDDLQLVTSYLEHKKCNMQLLVRAAFREGCLTSIAHVLKHGVVKEYLKQIPDGDLLISILETSINCGNRRQICDLAAALPLPSSLLLNPSIKKVLEPKPEFMWYRQLARGLNQKLPSDTTAIIFNLVFDNRALISHAKIAEIAKSGSKAKLKD
jgi:hypothetical protein